MAQAGSRARPRFVVSLHVSLVGVLPLASGCHQHVWTLGIDAPRLPISRDHGDCTFPRDRSTPRPEDGAG